MPGDIGYLMKDGKKENIMKLYLQITKMDFEEDSIEHNIIRGISDKEFFGYDEMIELPDNDKFIKDVMKIIYKKDKKGNDTDEIDYKAFMIREQEMWLGFPLYELKNNKIKHFDYTKYIYFANSDRRNMLTRKMHQMYNPSSEFKRLRKILKKILDHLGIVDKDFKKYNDKIEGLIAKNPK